MTYDEYISSPMGKNNSVMSNRNMYKEKYTKDWDLIRLRANGEIGYRLYTSDDDWYAHFKIPTEMDTDNVFFYDTVVRFHPTDSTVKMENHLKNYEVQFFSNDPNFVFTFCYAFKTHKLLISDLESKMPKLALTQPAVVKNPKNEVGYVKSIYFMYLEMKRLQLFTKNKWAAISSKYSKNVWTNTVDHADDKIKEANESADAARKKRIKEKNKKKNEEFVKGNKKDSLHKFDSPNQKGIGHFKSSKPEKLVNSSIEKNIGRFKK